MFTFLGETKSSCQDNPSSVQTWRNYQTHIDKQSITIKRHSTIKRYDSSKEFKVHTAFFHLQNHASEFMQNDIVQALPSTNRLETQ